MRNGQHVSGGFMERKAANSLIVITGCDTGIGAALCRIYLMEGFTVVAGYFGTPPEPASALHQPLSLDLRSEISVSVFASGVLSKISQGYELYAIIHNAGMVAAAPMECIPLEAVREVFEVNFFGAYSLTQKLISSVIRDRGRIALVGSLAGRIALPFFSPYVASKFAMEGWADSLRREMAPFGINTILFEPGAVATPIWNNSWKRICSTYLPLVFNRYNPVFEQAGARFVAGGNAGMSVEKAARKMYAVISSNRPRARYIISNGVWLNYLELMLPTRLLDRLIAIFLGTDKLGNKKGGAK